MNHPKDLRHQRASRTAVALLFTAMISLAIAPGALASALAPDFYTGASPTEKDPLAGPGAPSVAQVRRDIDILNTVIRYIKTDYLEVPDPNKSMPGAFQGLVNALDVMSGYLDKTAAVKYNASKTAPLKDVGAVVFKRTNAFPLVIAVVPGSPAEKAGVKMGDFLSALDDRSTLVWSLSEIDSYLKDTAASTVKLRVIRENTTKEIPVTRADVYPRALTYAPQAGTAGILTIHHLYAPLAADLAKTVVPAVKALKAPLIVDLRDCHEGDPSVVAAFLNFFLAGDKAGGFEKKNGEKEILALPNPAPLAGLPIVVWTNQATLGPAEIVAAALKDQRQAKVVGIETPGLASKQEVFPLDSGDALLLTTGVYVTASGRKIWGVGVTPDVAVEAGKTATKDYLAKTTALSSGR
jgi:carboxyl-terminal processing protease